MECDVIKLYSAYKGNKKNNKVTDIFIYDMEKHLKKIYDLPATTK